MAQQVLEGTWEEIRAHEPELAGQHVRLTIMRPEWPISRPPQTPPVIYDPSSDSELTDEIRGVLDPFLDFLLADIQENAIDANKVEIWGEEYPDDGTSKILVHLWLTCDTDEEAWRYFGDFYSRLEGWLNRLNRTDRLMFSRKISFMTWRMKNA